MANYLQNSSYRDLQFGPQVTKTAQNLPQTTTAGLFTVNTGRVMVTSLVGAVTSALGATATNLSLGMITTDKTSNTSIAGTKAVTSLPVNTMVVPAFSGAVSTNLVPGTDSSTAVQTPSPFVVNAGTITWTTTGSDTGQMAWYLTYVPLDAGANVT